MATTTTTATFTVTGDNIDYTTPSDYDGENASFILTTTGTVSGANDVVEADYGTNDVITVTGVNDSVYDFPSGQNDVPPEGDLRGFGHARINAQNATGNGDYEVEGPDSTILAGGGNDDIVSYGGFSQTTNSSSTTTGGTTTDNDQTVTTVGNILYGGAGDDIIHMAYADTVYSGAGNDVIVLQLTDVDAAPTYTGSSHLPGAYIDLGTGNDVVNLFGTQTYVNSNDDTVASGSSFDYSTIIGGNGKDTIEAGFYNDLTITVGSGNDVIEDVGNDSTIHTGAGDNFIYDIADGATIVSGAGNDIIEAVGNDAYISAGDGNNVIEDVNTGATILSGAGNDIIEDVGGNSSIVAGAGNDSIDGVGSNSFIDGGAGDDTIIGTSGDSVIYGHAGNDVIQISGSNDVVFAGAGNDIVTATGGYAGNHFISADLGNDTVDLHLITGGNDTVYGGGGDDTIYGSMGTNDQLYGNAGNDTIHLNGGSGVVYGGQGNDLIYDNSGGDSFISGDLGDDSIFSTGANDSVNPYDIIYGGGGNDSIAASGFGDALYGQAGNDVITFDGHTATSASTPDSPEVVIYGGMGNDLITVSFSSSVSSGTYESYTASAETTEYSPYTEQSIPAGGGSFTYTTVTDGAGYHFLSGDIGADTIYGGSGGDTFVGGAGSDQLYSNRLTASGNDPAAPGYQSNGAGDDGSGTTDTAPSTVAGAHGTEPSYASNNLADHFDFFANDSVGTSPTSPGTGSDISQGGGEAGIDHIHGFLLNVSGQAQENSSESSSAQSFINSQTGDDLYFLTGANTVEGSAQLDTNVFYGTVANTIPASTVTEQSDYAVAYAYAFGPGGTSTTETGGAHFAAAVDFIVVNVVDGTVDGSGNITAGANNNGNIFVFDHNGNAVALDGAGLTNDPGTVSVFQNTASPTGTGTVNAAGESTVSVNIYH